MACRPAVQTQASGNSPNAGPAAPSEAAGLSNCLCLDTNPQDAPQIETVGLGDGGSLAPFNELPILPSHNAAGTGAAVNPSAPPVACKGRTASMSFTNSAPSHVLDTWQSHWLHRSWRLLMLVLVLPTLVGIMYLSTALLVPTFSQLDYDSSARLQVEVKGCDGELVAYGLLCEQGFIVGSGYCEGQ